MSPKADKNLLVGLDIGTSKVVAIVAEMGSDGQIAIIGVGHHPSQGLKRGVVVNIEATIHSIQQAVSKAEKAAGCRIHSVYTGIAGNHIQSQNSHGIVAIRDKEVTQADIDRVIDAAKAVPMSTEQKLIHVLPQHFSVDNQPGIKDPIGMSGVRLEADVHIVTGAVSAAQNIVKCIRAANIEVDDIILEQLASSYAVLTDDEKELGVCLVDIGGGTTDIAVFYHGAIQHTAVIPIAGDQVTNDIAVAFHLPTVQAEAIKIQYGYALAHLAENAPKMDITSNAHRSVKEISAFNLAKVIEPRYDELFSLVQANLKQFQFPHPLSAGIVLTGGSTSIPGVVELAEKIFQVPVRLGVPTQVVDPLGTVNNPVYSTGVGLLLYGKQRQSEALSSVLGRGIPGMWNRMKGWFHGRLSL